MLSFLSRFPAVREFVEIERSTISERTRQMLRWLLLEEMEDDEIMDNIYGLKRAEIRPMFVLRETAGLYQQLIRKTTTVMTQKNLRNFFVFA